MFIVLETTASAHPVGVICSLRRLDIAPWGAACGSNRLQTLHSSGVRHGRSRFYKHCTPLECLALNSARLAVYYACISEESIPE